MGALTSDGYGHHGRRHHHIHSYGGWPAWGFGFGAFAYMPPYHPPAYYGYPPVRFRPAPPAVSIERKDLSSLLPMLPNPKGISGITAVRQRAITRR